MDSDSKTRTLKELSIGNSDDPIAPKAGSVMICEECGFTVNTLRDCKCPDLECVALCCCGSPMLSAN